MPSTIDPAYAALGFDKVHFFEIGPGIGYAYTVVFNQHFFVLASATVNLDLRFLLESGLVQRSQKVDISPDYIFHAGAGYNSDNWDLSVKWVGNQVYAKGAYTGYRYSVSTGNYRLIYARRLTLSHKVKKVLQPINELMENK